MCREIEQNSVADLNIGPFLLSTDGDTEQTGLTINQSDVLVSKNGGAFSAKNKSGGGAHDTKGMYRISLDATDSNTLGSLKIYVHVAGALYVTESLQIVSGFSTQQKAEIKAKVDQALIDYDGVVFSDLPADFIDLDIKPSTGEVTVGTNNDKSGYALSTAGIKAVWDQLTSALTTAGSMGKFIIDEITLIKRLRNNKMFINKATSKQEMYDDAGTSVIQRWPLTDKNSNAINLQGTGPANRGAPEL